MLALALLRTLLARLWVRRSSLLRFEQHYAAEGIVAVTEDEARVLGRAGRCIACGLCDQVVSAVPGHWGGEHGGKEHRTRQHRGSEPVPATAAAPSAHAVFADGIPAAVAPVSVMGFVLAGTRCLTDFDASSRMLDHLPEEALREAEAVCPRDVPIVALSELVLCHQARVLRAVQR